MQQGQGTDLGTAGIGLVHQTEQFAYLLLAETQLTTSADKGQPFCQCRILDTMATIGAWHRRQQTDGFIIAYGFDLAAGLAGKITDTKYGVRD